MERVLLRDEAKTAFKRGRTWLDGHCAVHFNLRSNWSAGFWVKVGLTLLIKARMEFG